MTVRYVRTSDDALIAYRLDGSADRPALVLSNSIATTLQMWDNVVDELSRDYLVVRYDHRGHGASSVPPGDYSLARLGQDVVELMDELGIERAHVVGLSLGGIVAQWLAIHAHERIDRLVLSNTAPYLGPPEIWREPIGAALAADDMTETAETFLRNWLPAELLYAGPVADTFRQMVLATNRHGLAGAWAAVRDADLREEVASIQRPTLVIAGRHDPVTAPEHGELLARTIPGAQLHVMDTVHLSNVQDRDGFLALITPFLAAGTASGTSAA